MATPDFSTLDHVHLERSISYHNMWELHGSLIPLLKIRLGESITARLERGTLAPRDHDNTGTVLSSAETARSCHSSTDGSRVLGLHAQLRTERVDLLISLVQKMEYT